MKDEPGKGRGLPGPPREEGFLEVFRALLARVGDLGFGPEDFLGYLESLPSAGKGAWKKIPFSRLEDFFLCLGLLRGSGRAFHLFEAKYALRLFQAASRAGFPGEDGRDALQETFALCLAASRGEGKSPLETFKGRGSLFGFVRTVFLRRLVRKGAARRGLARLEEEDLLPGREPDPGTQAAEKEKEALFRDLVGGALESLCPKIRAFLLAVHSDGEPATRAAVRLGLLPGHARHLRTRASRLHALHLASFRKALIERAHRVYGLDGDELRLLLEKVPLHPPGNPHLDIGSRREEWEEEGRGSHG